MILGFVPLTMALGFLLAAAGFVFWPLASVLAWFVNIVLSYEIGVITLFSRFYLPVSGFGSLAAFLFYYAILLWVIMSARARKKNEEAR